jgi:hypothetical protein
MAFDTTKLPKLDRFLAQYKGTPGRAEGQFDPELLDQIKAYDPDAHFQDDWSENGGSTRTLIFDHSKLPEFKGDMTNAASLSLYGKHRLKNKKKIFKDDVYGDWTTHDNIIKDKDKEWTKWAPLVVGVGAPMAAGAFLGATGIGLGAAGTSAVTGGAAGLSAANIASGVGSGALTAGQRATQQFGRGLPNIARSVSEGNFNPTSLLGPALGAAGMGDVGKYIGYAQMANNIRRRR